MRIGNRTPIAGVLTRLVQAECETQNIASARVMQKCGMEYEGKFYDDDIEKNWANRYRYKITARMLETH
jgi:RimJ/RimL family protein N-acetyltransferase